MRERIVSFWVGEQIYGVPLLIVGEFCPSMQISPVEAVDARITGISHIRESSVVVLGMQRVLGTTSKTRSQAKDAIYILPQHSLCEEALTRQLTSFEEPVVLEVDRLECIMDVDTDDMHPTPAHLSEDFYDGVFDTAHGDLILINFTKLIDYLLIELNEAQR